MQKDLTASQNDYARFLPALSGFYATYVGKQRYDEYVDKSRIPSNFTHGVESLNYLNKTEGQFQYQWTLYSAGHAELDVKSIFVHKSYTPDFIMGSMIVEAKGRFTSVDRTKMAQVVKENPNLDIRMLFMRDQWCTKTKKQKYSDWCDTHNIKFAFGISLPKEWLKELR